MRILFLTHYFPPEGNAPAVRTFEHCREWVKQGHEVHVITGYPSHPRGRLYPGYKRGVGRHETMSGIHVHRIWTYLAPNQGVFLRALNYVSFVLPALWQALRLRRADVIIATSPQFFCAVAGWLVAKAKRRPWVFEVRDLWPESIAAVGAVRAPLLLRPLEWMARLLYRDANAVVCLTKSFVDAVEAQGIERRKLHYVPNGIEAELWGQPVDRGRWRDRLGVGRDQLLVGYVGTLGMAHALDTVLDAAEALSTHPSRPVFVLAGDGADRDRLERLAHERSIRNVLFTGQVPRSEVPGLLGSLDIALVVLRDTPVFKTVLPSKMFEAMAAARSVVLGVDGEARRVLEASGGGLFCTPEDSRALADAVVTLAEDDSRRQRCGEQGRAFVLREFDRRSLASGMAGALEGVVADHRTHDLRWRERRDARSQRFRPLLPPLPDVAEGQASGDPVPDISIVIPIRNEERHLPAFLDSLVRMRSGGRSVEVFFVEGCSQDRTLEILEQRIPDLREATTGWTFGVLDNPSGAIPSALNRGILTSRGQVIVRLDAHSLFPEDYLECCLEALATTGADNVGGIVKAVAGGNTLTACAIARARSDLFGAGTSSFRTTTTSGQRRTVPFGCFRRKTFERWRLFDSRLKRNQDLEMNHRIRQGDGRVHQVGSVASSYFAPRNYWVLLRKHFANGRWNVFVSVVAPGCLTWEKFVPGLFIILLAVLSAWLPAAGVTLASLALAADYLRAKVIHRDDVSCWRLAIAFVCIQVGHGLGQVEALLELPWFMLKSTR